MNKDIDDALDEATMINNDTESELPESPASANIKTWIDDYGVQFTVRDKKVSEVVKRIEFLVEMFKRKGWKPTWSTNGLSKPTTVSQNKGLGDCPTCGEPLTEGETKKGDRFVKCSTNIWNRRTKQAEGCDYIKWL